MNVGDCIAIVTGGVSGLGEATVRELLSGGARVCMFDIQDEKGEALDKELGDKAIYAHTDITDGESVQAGINKTVDTFGGLNCVINCAGVGPAAKILSKKGPMSQDFFNNVLQINLAGTVNVIRLAVEKMSKNDPITKDGEKGVIVNTASVAAYDGQIGQAAYAASKAGIVGMTLPIARECAAYGIRVNTIAPGIFQTPMLMALPENVQESLGKMVPFPQRLGKPSEYAQLVRQMIENTMLNGECVRLDGAIRMQPK